MKVLVTGAAGYIVSVLVRQLLDRCYQVVGFDRLMFDGESLISVYNHNNLEHFFSCSSYLDPLKIKNYKLL